ncbi:glutathione S-transferase family protein [Aristophania vespae]|uniref:glutathione S-transferase family protein n=1 Tax=Aristophania vespae TaxID=2697033 RepID=UPI0023514713|nr:glutathione S-transferase family protein [Aristophania vespae]UMM63738.1 Glutathione S-transferase [Aristophania vespae]
MYKLYSAYGTMGLSAHIVLEALDVPYEIHFLDLEANEQKSSNYLKINPNGRVPALILQDGRIIYESSAILVTLADAHPEAGLAPRPEEAQRPEFLQWMFFLTNSLQATMMHALYPDRLVGDVSEDVLDAVRSGALQRVESYLKIIEAHLAKNGPYFLGNKTSVADIHLALTCRALCKTSVSPRNYPHIATFLNKIDALPYVRRACEQENIEGTLA